ncbi:MAG: hypothetical protein ABF854_09240, partial [Gluconacetobacter sp.]
SLIDLKFFIVILIYFSDIFLSKIIFIMILYYIKWNVYYLEFVYNTKNYHVWPLRSHFLKINETDGFEKCEEVVPRDT